jgi:hypothetical protein
MAGAYQEIPIGFDYFFTSNVATRRAALSANFTSATYSWVLREFNEDENDSATNIIALTNTPSANGNVSVNATTNVATVTVTKACTANVAAKPLLYWVLSVTQADGLKYVLDQGRGCVVNVPGHQAGGGVGA